MTCRFCTWLCDRFCPPERRSSALWDAAQDWEERFASEWEPGEEGDDLRARWREAKGLEDDDPAAALAIHRELAEAGSPFSMLKAGWHFEYGRGVEADAATAEDFYRRALSAGSWRGTIYYAKLLYKRGAHDKWPSTLGDGVDKGFIPAFFWLAWYRHQRSPGRKTAREVRHLLETAAEAGHPGAGLVLARWTASGKFGLRRIPEGFRMLREVVQSLISGEDAAAPAVAGLAPAERDRGIDGAAVDPRAERAAA